MKLIYFILYNIKDLLIILISYIIQALLIYMYINVHIQQSIILSIMFIILLKLLVLVKIYDIIIKENKR